MRGTEARKRAVVLAALAAAFVLLGCSESTYIGSYAPNKTPTIELTNGPFERSLVGYQIEFSWMGNDEDGTVRFYEYAICDGDPVGFSPSDTAGTDKWHRTMRTDSLFKFMADEFDTNLATGNPAYSRNTGMHTFFVRAVDDRGARSEAAHRSFTAYTYAPYVEIDSPTNPFPGQAQTLPPITTFRWTGYDPIDKPNKTQEVDSIRYMLTSYTMVTLDQLNEHPETFERLWSKWYPYEAPGDSGRSTTVGDDEVLSRLHAYILAIQAKDEAGAITSVFSLRDNARAFAVLPVPGPILGVSEPYLGILRVQGTNNRAQTFSLPAGFVLHFSWSADASSYGGVILSYRYGWDVLDLNDPNDWDVYASPYVKSAPPRVLSAGIHTLYVEAVDNNGKSSIAEIEIEAFPVDMSKNLLWVDDFNSLDFDQKDYGYPTESQHDAFWTRICSRADGFVDGRDVIDTRDFNYQPPDMQLIWQYKNIIWTYTNDSRVNAWDDVVRFIPESYIGSVFPLPFNYLAYYLSSGGHLWTSGRSDRQGGLAAVLWLERAQVFPLYLKCEITGPRTGCTGDTSGVRSMAYRDYCVSVLDKAVCPPRESPSMPVRRSDWDAMAWAFKDSVDQITAIHPGIPKKLVLWEEVTKPGRFFDPQVQGFTYVEVYNPAYWMAAAGSVSQSCFHPIYRMRTRNSHSAVNNQVVAFWTTKYASVVAPVPGAVAAPSVHFGFPLWFFNRAEVDSIADVVFDTWGIGGAH